MKTTTTEGLGAEPEKPGGEATRPEASATPAVQGLTERLYDAIEQVLLHYRGGPWVDEDGDPLGLVDVLTPAGERSVAEGQHQIRLICDAIYNDDGVRAALSAPEQAAQSPELSAEPPELTTGAARPIFDQLAEMGRNFAEQAAQQEAPFAVGVAARKWAGLLAEGHHMRHIAFSGPKGDGTIDRWGKVLWTAQQADAALTDEWIDALLDELDDIARKHDRFGEYGLPLHCDSDDEAPHAAIRKAVRAAMAASKKEG